MERPLTGVKGAPLFPLFRHQRQQPCAERVGREVVGGDEQHGVVAGEGADDVGPVLVVDGHGDGVGVAGRGLQDEQY